MPVLGLGGNIADGLVEQEGSLHGLTFLPGFRQLDLCIGENLGAEFGNHLAIDDDESALNVAVGLASRAHAAGSHDFG